MIYLLDKMEKKKLPISLGLLLVYRSSVSKFEGVSNIVSGYMGGEIKNPPREVCTGRTGHAEGIRLNYDPAVISYTNCSMCFLLPMIRQRLIDKAMM